MNEADNILVKEVEKQKAPSVNYLIFNKDKIIHRFEYGFVNIKNKKSVEEGITYNAYSVTKTFTALAILQLAEQNKIDIDQQVNKYLPDFPYSPEITIRQLMTHSAGIPNPIPLSWIHLTDEHKSFNRNDFFNHVFTRNTKTKSKPNEKFEYSNLGYVILGQLIEKVSGISYEQFINDNILTVLGFQSKDIGFTIDDPFKHAKGYHKRLSFSNLILGFLIDKSKYMEKREGKWIPFKDFYVNGVSYGGLIGTPQAFVKYIQELLKSDCKLINEYYKKMLFFENCRYDGTPTGMCLSWFKGKLNGKEYFAHAGGGGGYYCEIRIYPEIGFGSVIMFNRTGMSDERFLDNVDYLFVDRK